MSYSKLIQYCLQANLTAYDASYLVLAEAEKIPMITADEKLIKAVEKEIPLAMTIFWVYFQRRNFCGSRRCNFQIER